MCSAVLVFEAIVLWLSVPVMITISDLSPGKAGALGGSLGVACVIVAGLLGRSWGYAAGHVMQLALVAVALVVPSMFFVGGVFAGLWLLAYIVGLKIDPDRQPLG